MRMRLSRVLLGSAILAAVLIAVLAQPQDPEPSTPNSAGAEKVQDSSTVADQDTGGAQEDDEELMRRLQEFRKKKKQKAGDKATNPSGSSQKNAQTTEAEPRKPEPQPARAPPAAEPAGGQANTKPPEQQPKTTETPSTSTAPPPTPSPPPPPPLPQTQTSPPTTTSPPPPPPPTSAPPPPAAATAPPPPPPPSPPPPPPPPPSPKSSEPTTSSTKKADVNKVLQGYADSASKKADANTPSPQPVPHDHLDDEVDGELSELEIERMAFEAAERAVKMREEQEAALKEARERVNREKEEQKRRTADAREEAQRLFNEQDLARKMRGMGHLEINVRPQDFRCVQCHTAVIGARGRTAMGVIEKLLTLGESIYAVARPQRPGVVEVPRWYAELMAKARFRGLDLKWGAADVRAPSTLDEPMRGAKLAVYVAASTDYSSMQKYRARKDNNGPQQVDYLGLKNVARAALDHGIERLIVISAAGASRPIWSRLKSLLIGDWGKFVSSEHYWKRKGEQAVIEECLKSQDSLSYTIIRPTKLGNSSWENSFKVEPSHVKVSQGDHATGMISRATLAAVAVESAFVATLQNAVIEVTGRTEPKVSRRARGDGDPSTWEQLFKHVLPGDGKFERLRYYQNRQKFRALQQELVAVTVNSSEGEVEEGAVATQSSNLKAEL